MVFFWKLGALPRINSGPSGERWGEWQVWRLHTFPLPVMDASPFVPSGIPQVALMHTLRHVLCMLLQQDRMA